MNKDSEMTYEEKLKEELELVRCDLHNAYSSLNAKEQENKQLKEIIYTIFNWNIFKNECPMNFAYDRETNEDKAQETFFENDDYCENNCNGDYKKCWLKYFIKMQKTRKR